ncbi:MAG: peptide chain release factor-like protein [Phycisphaeraceae bacterium]
MADPTPAHEHPAALDDASLLKHCRMDQTRGGGPGGQHRNKTATGIRLTHEPTGITAQAGERRSQADNRRQALRRLRVKLALHVRCDVAGSPSALWQSRCRGGRLSINPDHADFPALLAEALDWIVAAGEDIKRAATALGVSTTQLVGLLRDEPAALEQVNHARQARGRPTLR